MPAAPGLEREGRRSISQIVAAALDAAGGSKQARIGKALLLRRFMSETFWLQGLRAPKGAQGRQRGLSGKAVSQGVRGGGGSLLGVRLSVWRQ